MHVCMYVEHVLVEHCVIQACTMHTSWLVCHQHHVASKSDTHVSQKVNTLVDCVADNSLLTLSPFSFHDLVVLRLTHKTPRWQERLHELKRLRQQVIKSSRSAARNSRQYKNRAGMVTDEAGAGGAADTSAGGGAMVPYRGGGGGGIRWGA